MEFSNRKLHICTPLVYSKHLSDTISKSVFMKLENTQPSGSFKLRGISQLCKHKLSEGCKLFVGSSGGNAGMALAYSAWQFQIPCELFVPNYISSKMLNKLRAYGASVTVTGEDWKMANSEALRVVQQTPNAGFIHPYDHPMIWEGNSSLVEEIKEQLQGVKPCCIITNVGGGGLLLGILKGLEKTGWEDVAIVAVETVGADCFNKSLHSGEIVEVEVTSIAKSLGARSVAPALWELYGKFNIISSVVTDNQAVSGSLQFAEDHQYLVEVACGASLAVIYDKSILTSLAQNSTDSTCGPIVIVICGGSDITPQKLLELAEKFRVSLAVDNR